MLSVAKIDELVWSNCGLILTGKNRSTVRQACHSTTVSMANNIQGVCPCNVVFTGPASATVSSAVTPRVLVNVQVSDDSEKCAASIFRLAA